MKVLKREIFGKIGIALFIGIALLVWLGKRYDQRATASGNIFSIEQVHNAITQGEAWLNVSNPLQPEDLKGRIVLVHFWTSYCINSIHTLPEIRNLQSKFADKLTILGVHSGTFNGEASVSSVRHAVIRYGITYPVVHDATRKILKSFHMSTLPTLLIINPEGKVHSIYSGEGFQPDVEQDIELLLKKYHENIVTTPLSFGRAKTEVPCMPLLYPSKLIYVSNYSGQPALFVADSGHNQIVGLRTNGKIFSRIGSGMAGYKDGDFKSAQFNNPQGLLFKEDVLYVADAGNHLLRKIDLNAQSVCTLAGTGKRGNSKEVKAFFPLLTDLASPWDLAWYPSEHEIVIAMAGAHQLWVYNTVTQTLEVLLGKCSASSEDGVVGEALLAQPCAVSAFKDKLYFIDADSSSLRVLHNEQVTTLVGCDFHQTDKYQARMQHPLGLCVHPAGVLIADSYNHIIRFYDTQSKTLKKLSGNGKPGITIGSVGKTHYNEPRDIVKGKGNIFYVADTNNHRIVVIDMEHQTTQVLSVEKE